MSSSPRRTETAVPARNFTLTTEDRVRAAAAGPPAYMRRLRTIEDLEEGIVRVLVELCEESRAGGAPPEAQAEHARAAAPKHALRRLDDLIARHNRWYPIEANLPMQPRSGELIDRTGEPWRPMRAPSLDELLARAMSRVAATG
jgi:hypothetical protein